MSVDWVSTYSIALAMCSTLATAVDSADCIWSI